MRIYLLISCLACFARHDLSIFWLLSIFWAAFGRWPWKSEPVKECVTTHLPNQLALIMDGAEASYPDSAVGARRRPRRVGGRGGDGAVSGASPGEAASGADLGGSCNYSNEIFED